LPTVDVDYAEKLHANADKLEVLQGKSGAAVSGEEVGNGVWVAQGLCGDFRYVDEVASVVLIGLSQGIEDGKGTICAKLVPTSR
jgi:hypothetical protein